MFLLGNKNFSLSKRLGFSKDQEGILKRYLRETEAWASHLQKTKEAIIHMASNKNKNKAAILGSGWLLDVPIEILCELFEEVWLFDINHPAQIKLKTSKFNNIRLKEADISGFSQPIYNHIKMGKQRPSIENLTPDFSIDLKDFDYIVSCNLLNQLDIILLDYLKRHIRISEHEEHLIRSKIQETHLSILPPSKTCLITDVEEIWMNKHNEPQGQKNLLYASIPANSIFDNWVWKFDNHFSYHDHCKTWFKVIACDI